ncbi:MAG: hypothetical protein CBC83_02325 [Flavobacteriales bacterium TMED123]|nr:hypothetical protein [Candidatus Neomarinimicrobiota bacterium]MAJ44518.1 hypothetical protein [Candidatus Neomarinimicrobiota bacterium]OUV73954.1 MAG: hypothetical protein CBC83_04770 [Flavobacteriales bacterium TMED123]OUV75595.1 MAG: hypothetical protein CBC83_02325 [Flavobacteriales bacterium TMED123]|tara:strand:- start:4563 stop:5003 length:441 start_codon:yes stop_codon:yes gene_type:complete
MLAELAVANAAFQVIKTAVQNGNDLAKVAHKIADYTHAKTDIEKKVREDKSRGRNSADLESFMALEEIREQENSLKEIMIWAGEPGQWDRWVKFQADARIARKKEEEEREKWATELYNNVGIAAIVIAVLLGLYGLFLFVLYLQGL